MKYQTLKPLTLAGLALAASVAISQAQNIAFRGDMPVDRAADMATPATDLTFRDAGDVMVRSAVAVSAAGISDAKDTKGFVPMTDGDAGNFERRPYHFTFSVNSGYDDNIYTSSFDKQDSFFTSASIGANLKIGDQQTSITAALTAGGDYYWDRNDNFDPDITLGVSLTHVFTPKLRLDISTYLAFQSEPDFQTGFSQVQRNGNYFYGNVGLNLTQSFTRRFSTVYSYSIGGIYYDESSIADLENRIEQTFGLQLRYLIKPTISLVGEYRFGVVTYDADNRDSTSQYILGGLDFALNRRLSADVRVGAQIRDADDTGTDTSPFAEGTLSYKYAEHSTLNWVNRYGYEESDFGPGTLRKTYRTGLTVNHFFTPKISVNGGAFYSTSDYSDGIGQDEQTLDLNVGGVYSINKLVSLQVGYTYTKIYSDDDFREYDRNRVYAGATLSF